MTGYVIADKPEMKVREYELYNAYYCGVCKSIADRYGQIPRLLLSYDSAFAAVLLAGLSEEKEKICSEHCIIHPVKKKFIIREEPAVDYAADILLILAYAKLEDDIRDEGKVSARSLHLLLKGAFRKLQAAYPKMCREISALLEELSGLEKEKSDSLDRTCELFGKVMAVTFSSWQGGDAEKPVLEKMGDALGRWMYLVDAWDDIGENIRDGNYNPLIYRFGFDPSAESETAFRERILERVRFLLYHYLGEMSKAYDLLTMRKNKGITDNVVYFGLHRKTEEVLKKGTAEKENERSL